VQDDGIAASQDATSTLVVGLYSCCIQLTRSVFKNTKTRVEFGLSSERNEASRACVKAPGFNSRTLRCDILVSTLEH
jgi:hypothetical protein